MVRATIIFKKIGSMPLLQTLKALILKPLIRKPFSRYTGDRLADYKSLQIDNTKMLGAQTDTAPSASKNV